MKHIIFAFIATFATLNTIYSQTVPCDSLDPLPRPWGVKKDWVGYPESRKIKILIENDTCKDNRWASKTLQEYRYATESLFYRYENTPGGMRLTRQSFWKEAEGNFQKANLNRKPGGIVITGGEEIIIDTFSINDQELGFRIIKNWMLKTSWLNDSLGISGINKFTKHKGLLSMEVSIDYLNTTYTVQGQMPNGMHVGVSWFLSNNGGPFKAGKLWISPTNPEKISQHDLFFDFSVDAENIIFTSGFPQSRKIYNVEHEALVDFFRAICSK